MAVWAGAENAVRLHIDRGDDLNSRDDAGLTPLMIAAARNKSAVCRLLIDAGADLTAVDATGKSALAIAVASGAVDAATEIELALRALSEQLGASQDSPWRLDEGEVTGSYPTLESDALGIAVVDSPNHMSQVAGLLPSRQLDHTTATAEACPAKLVPGPIDTATSPVSRPRLHFDFRDDGEPLDLSGWEAEEEKPAPADDRPAAISHVATQEAIAQHTPLDDSADWADFEADLPAHAAPLLRAQDAEGRVELRTLLLRASREGSVPEQAVEDVCRDANGARDTATESLLRLVLNDMGAEADERFEFRSPSESFQVFVDPDESATEAEEVEGALGFLDNLRSRHNDPMRLYMRDAQRGTLLTASEEIELGQSMELAAEQAIAALAGWAAGIRCVVAAIASAHQGERSVGSIVSSVRDAMEPEEALSPEGAEVDEADSLGQQSAGTIEADDDGSPSPRPQAETPGMLDIVEKLAAMSNHADSLACEAPAARLALTSLSLRRSFLIELANAMEGDSSAPAAQYANAIRALRLPRDRMVRANLRLVLSLAKRHMYSGVPMDDLVQEGNIGLMTAVDKFEWRRGLRFSTMATWWIRQHISRSVADSSLAIRLPVHAYEVAQRFPREQEALEKELGNPPSIQHLANRLGLEPRKIEPLLRAVSIPLPIEAIDEESGLEPSEGFDHPFEKVAAAHLHRTLDELLAELGTKPEKILRLRYGIGVDEPRTLEEIGVLYEVTRERIRQIEFKALTKLKHPNWQSKLRCWSLDDGASTGDMLAVQSGDEDAIAVTPQKLPTTRRLKPDDEKPAKPVDGKRLTPIERVLREATILGIPVEQSVHENETTTWVSVTTPAGGRERKLIRSLLAMGFAYWPGRGYWR